MRENRLVCGVVCTLERHAPLERSILSNTFDYDSETEGTELDSVTVGSLSTQHSSSLWGGVQHRGVFDMFQRQDTMLSDSDRTIDGGPADGPFAQTSPVHFILRRLSDGASFPLPNGIACVVGRGKKCDINVSDDAHLSRKHACITCSDEGATIIDLGSANGTWIGGKRISEGAREELKYGQPFALSKCEFVVVRETL